MTAWRAESGGLRVTVRVQPGAKADRFEGVEATADGGHAIKVRLTAPPADGKANAALVKLLAKRWKLAKSDVSLRAGASGRLKTLHLRGDAGTLAARLAADVGSAESED